MVQRSLHEFFPSNWPPEKAKKTTFLHLAIRRRIYLEAGLPINRTISLNYLPPVDESGYEIDYPELDLDVGGLFLFVYSFRVRAKDSSISNDSGWSLEFPVQVLIAVQPDTKGEGLSGW
jgi:hypothetical protein